MPLPIPPPLGHHVPPTRHAVSAHFNFWDEICGMFKGDPRLKDVQINGYPRSFIHSDIKKMVAVCKERFIRHSDRDCLIFPSYRAAVACQEFITREKNEPFVDTATVSIIIVEFDMSRSKTVPFLSQASQLPAKIQLAVVFFPSEALLNAMTFWRLAGQGISSRLAERCLPSLKTLAQVTDLTDAFPRQKISPAHKTVCQRIANLLNRTTPDALRQISVSTRDVYLYQSGMSAIYHVQQLLSEWRGTESIVFGFPYELTLKFLQAYGLPPKHYPFGTAEDMDELEVYLEVERATGRKIQAIWCECPSNPLLRTVDLHRLRGLADKYDFIIIVDETIGSFANLDLLGVADILVTSLTKIFNGQADVLAGSIVLNPTSKYYLDFTASLKASYHNDVFISDVIQLELNSRNYLDRVTKINNSALFLVSQLQSHVSNPNSPITHIFYPTTCWSRQNYEAVMRTPFQFSSTKQEQTFTPGYGGLFTIEFESVAIAEIFFNHLTVHKGPSLGAPLTLAQPYVQTVFWKEKEFAARCGLKESIVRISVGLEEKELLREAFESALGVAMEVMDERRRRRERETVHEWESWGKETTWEDAIAITRAREGENAVANASTSGSVRSEGLTRSVL